MEATYLHWVPPANCHQVAQQLRQRLVATSIPGPLAALVGKQGYMQSVAEVWLVLQSPTLMHHLGFCILDSLVAALFPDVESERALPHSTEHCVPLFPSTCDGMYVCAATVKLLAMTFGTCLLLSHIILLLAQCFVPRENVCHTQL